MAAASLLHLAASISSPRLHLAASISSPRLHLAASISSPRLHLGPKTASPLGQHHPQVRLRSAAPRAYRVTIEHGGESRVVEMEEDENILERALEEGLEVPHDCKLGVCMTCPARLVSGKVDQSDGMLSDDVVAQGYALLCAAYPRSDCTIRVIPEDELLQVQLATAND